MRHLPAILSVFECPSRPAAEQRLKEIGSDYAQSAPKLVAWLEENLPQGFVVLTLPTAHRKRMRTSNALERVQEVKRRTRVAPRFSQRKIPPAANHRALMRNQRRLGNWKNLPQHGKPKPTLSLTPDELTEKRIARPRRPPCERRVCWPEAEVSHVG